MWYMVDFGIINISQIVVLKNQKATQEQCSCKVVNRENKFKAVSNTVWVCWKAMIEEKTIK